jgi:hypothetical protein
VNLKADAKSWRLNSKYTFWDLKKKKDPACGSI